MKRNGKPNTSSGNIQLGPRDGIWHRKMRHAKKRTGKLNMTEEIEIPKQKNHNLGEKETLNYMEILEEKTIKQVEMKGKIKN